MNKISPVHRPRRNLSSIHRPFYLHFLRQSNPLLWKIWLWSLLLCVPKHHKLVGLPANQTFWCFHLEMQRLKNITKYLIQTILDSLSLEKLNWDSHQGRDLATSGRNKEKFQLGQSYSYIMRKVWYHQIWIQNNLGFMVLILLYTPYFSVCTTLHSKFAKINCLNQ